LNERRKKIEITDVVFIGLFAAVVYGGQWLRIPIPTPIGNTAINFGNVFCLVAGFMLGPLRGGLSAGIGSYIFNLTHPAHFNVLPFQLVLRFVHAFVCGLIAGRGKNLAWKYAAAVAGQSAYIVLLMTQRYWWDAITVKGSAPAVAWAEVVVGLPVSLFNGVMAVVIAVPLALAMQKALGGVPLYRKFAAGRNNGG
jgi:uncharacterized membrane protein